MYEQAVRETIARFEATGSPVITDGEQRKYHNFWTYCVHGAPNTAPDGFQIPFADGHVRRMPRLVTAPFRYQRYADQYLATAQRYASKPVKQAVISPSALSLMYPPEGIDGYPREQFIDDLLNEQLDPSGELLNSFIDLNNLALSRFSAAEQDLLGVHTCPGGDHDSTHSADIDYAELLPSLFELKVGNFYIALARERDPQRVLKIIARHRKPNQRVFIGVIDPLDPHIESAEQVRDRILQAAGVIPVEHLGSTDDCGFSPFCDDQSTTRDTAFAKIRARVEGTALARALLKEAA
jgi:5-methyltetrahydropteroyltriglutamate--homocysteine methyltransferase